MSLNSKRGSAALVIEKANGEREKHKCPSELVVKVLLQKHLPMMGLWFEFLFVFLEGGDS